MYLPNTNHQTGLHRCFRADGTIISSSLPQLVLPVADTRAFLRIVNTSAAIMWMDHGPARATCTISSGTVNAITVVNGGFGYTVPPIVEFMEGYGMFVAAATTAAWNGVGFYGSNSPNGLAVQGDSSNPVYNRPAVGHAVLTSGKVTSIVIDDGGFGYINAPMVVLRNDPRDPFGSADPSVNITGSIYSGVSLAASGGSYSITDTAVWTDQVALYGTAGSAFVVEWMA